MVASTTGKKTERKIRNMAAASPTPNQRMANGIQAKGERLRKKFVMGRKARRAESFWPIQTPAGIPKATANRNPQVTRNNDVTLSLSSLPVAISTPKPRTTASGDGNALRWKTPALQTTVQTTMKIAATSAGSRRARTVFLFSFMLNLALGGRSRA